MAEAPNATENEEPICSVDSLQKFYEKHPRILLIATKDDRKDFAKKFANEAAPDDVAIVEVQAGGSCEVIEKLGLKDTPTAILVEKGEVKNRITLQDDDVKDTISLIKMLSEKAEPSADSCKAEVVIDKKGWKLKFEPGSPCERAYSGLDKLRPDVKKYLTKHIER